MLLKQVILLLRACVSTDGESLFKREGEEDHSEQKPALLYRLVIWVRRITQISAGEQCAKK